MISLQEGSACSICLSKSISLLVYECLTAPAFPKMSSGISAYIICVQQLYCDHSQQDEEFMDMLHQTITWRKKKKKKKASRLESDN